MFGDIEAPFGVLLARTGRSGWSVDGWFFLPGLWSQVGVDACA